jgi:hypothetical protein
MAKSKFGFNRFWILFNAQVNKNIDVVALLVKYLQSNENNMKVNHSLQSCLDFVIDIIYVSLFSPCFAHEKKGKLLMVLQ